MAKKTQAEKVCDWIDKYGKITMHDAIYELGISQLGARIFELKRAGFLIKKTPINIINREGEKIRVIEYSWQNTSDDSESNT